MYTVLAIDKKDNKKKEEVNNMDSTMIRVKPSTKKRLAKHGEFGDSHDDALNRVLDKAEKREAR